MIFESELAENVFRSKYLLEGETEPNQAVERVVKSVAKVFPEIEKDAYDYINNQWFIPAGGIWRAAGNPNKNVSHINCTTLGYVKDDLEDIFDNLYKWAKFAAFGQGEGMDISKLRPRNSKVHNSSRTSTGAVSFMSLYDAVLKVIAQQGRRGASLISIADSHPDIEEFISIKDKPETDKSRIDTANLSIQTTNKFMEAVKNNGEWLLHYENKYEIIEKKIKAKDLFDKICQMALKRGDPGLQFIDTWKKYSNSDQLGYPLESSNACFGPNEKLLTKEGYKTFKELNGTNVSILSDDGNYYDGKVFENGIKETIKITFNSNRSIIVTPEQKFKTLNGEVEAKNLKGETVLCFNNNFINTTFDIDWVKLGFIQGDGGIGRLKENSKHKGFELYIGDKDYDILPLFSKEIDGAYYGKEKRAYYIHNEKINSMLYEYGFDFSPLSIRDMPENIPIEKELSFLKGLFSANGYVTKKYRVGLKATSRILIDKVSNMLKKYKIDNYITTNKSKKVLFSNGEYLIKESYDINIGTIESLIKYYYLIGFIHSYKNDDLKNLLILKSPKVRNIKINSKIKIYDFSIPENHWGFVNNMIVHNCGEIPNSKYGVCALSQINLAKMEEYKFDGYKKLIDFGVKFINATRINEIYENRSPIKEQRENIINNPRIGLGLTGLADHLIDNKIPYGSPLSIEIVGDLFRELAKRSYETGYNLAKKFGSFPSYDKNKILKSEFVQRLINSGIVDKSVFDYQFNVAYNSIAPSGSVSIVGNVGGSGIEPLYSRYMVRRERSTTSDWKEHFIFNPYVERYLKEHNVDITRENADKLNFPEWVMSFDVNSIDKIKLVAEAQKWIDNAISVTFNLPEDATVKDVEHIYMSAWENELKGVTVYREGSLAGVLITEKNYNKMQENKSKELNRDETYERRPDTLNCDIHETKHKDNKFIVLVGLKGNKPYEVFITPNNDNSIDVEKYKQGKIIKKSSGHYDLIVENGITKTMINDIGKTFDSMYGTLSRMVSMSLRHNVPLQFIIDQLNKDSNLIAFEKVLSRVLKKYIKDGTSSKKKCPDCGGELVYEDGCLHCSDDKCGWSRCD